MPRKKRTRKRYTDARKKEILAVAKRQGLTGAEVRKRLASRCSASTGGVGRSVDASVVAR